MTHARHIYVVGEALMDCLMQPNGQLLPVRGGSPYNMARAARLRGAQVSYLNPLSSDTFGQSLAAQLQDEGVAMPAQRSLAPTALAMVQMADGHPAYSFYREGVADRDYRVDEVLAYLAQQAQVHGPGILHTGSLLLIPPESDKVLALLQAAKAQGWTISLDVNMRPSVAPDLAAYVQAVRRLMPLADWLKASDEDLQVLGFAGVDAPSAPAVAAQVRADGAPLASRLALTFGAQGAFLQTESGSAWRDAPAITLVDSVGAGDTFWGNCVAGWALAPGAADADDSLRHAMAAAAINCSRAGCQPPRWAETQAFKPL